MREYKQALALWKKDGKKVATYLVKKCSSCPACSYTGHPYRVFCNFQNRMRAIKYAGDIDLCCQKYDNVDKATGCVGCPESSFPVPPLIVFCDALRTGVKEQKIEPIDPRCPFFENKAEDGGVYVDWVKHELGY